MSSDPQTTFKNTVQNLTPFQKSLHEGGNNEHIISVFHREFNKSTYYNHYSEFMTINTSSPSSTLIPEDGESIITFNVSLKSQALLYSHLIQHLPTIECNDGYTAHWIKNVGTNVFTDTEFCVDDQVWQSLNYRYIDHLNAHLKNDDRIDFDMDIGNNEVLQTFSKKIPSFDTAFLMPFFYAKKPGTYFPLHKFGMGQKIEQKFKIRKSISKLMIVVNDNGEIVNFDSQSIKKIDGQVVNETNIFLQNPQLLGQYANLTEYDCNDKYCIIPNDCDSIYIEDTAMFDSENEVSLGCKIPIKLDNIKYPVTKIWWLAQNSSSVREYNDYSNYSTNKNRVTEYGWSPTQTATLTTSDGDIFKNVSHVLTQRIFPKMQQCKVPCEPGYNSWNMGILNNAGMSAPGKVFNDAKIIIDLKDTNPYLKIDEYKNNKSNDKFMVYVFLTYLKKINLQNCPKSESERPHNKTLFTFSGV